MLRKANREGSAWGSSQEGPRADTNGAETCYTSVPSRRTTSHCPSKDGGQMSKDKNVMTGLGKGKTAGRVPARMVPSSTKKIPLTDGREPMKMVPAPQKPATAPVRTETTALPARPCPTKE